MSQNTLIEKIKKDAALSVEEIRAGGAAELAKLADAQAVVMQQLQAEHDVQVAKKKEHAELVAISKAKQSANIAVQTAKREEIDAIFAEVEQTLVEQASDAYVTFFTPHMKAIVPADSVVTTVTAPKNRLDETKQLLQAVGLEGEVAATTTTKAGCVVTTENGVYDVTLERLLAEHRPALEMMIVAKVSG